MNLFTEVANASDTYWRTGVMIRALKDGRSIDEALTLAREALFDYGRMSAWERKYMADWVWFWRFSRENMRSVLRAFVNNPDRALHLMRLSKGVAEDDSFHPHTRAYHESRPFLALLDGPGRKRAAILAPTIPFAGGLMQLIDYIDKVKAVGMRLFEQGFKVAKPEVKWIAGLGDHVLQFDKLEKSGTYLEPQLVAALKSNPITWAMLNSVVTLEAVPQERMEPGETTFDGVGYRINKNDGSSRYTWNMLKLAALQVGMLNHIKDFGVWWTEEREGEITGVELEAPNKGLEYLRGGGAIRVGWVPREEDIPANNREEIERKLREYQGF
jgi:hypothetical protein